MDVVIRPYRNSDQKQILTLWQRCDLTRPWNGPGLDIERKLRVNPELFLVGEIDEKLIACVMGGYEGHRGWINYLAVDPDYRQQGIGRRMMEAIEKAIAALGCPKINLQVRTSNVNVIEFYKSIGYRLDDVVGMGKRLLVDEEYVHVGEGHYERTEQVIAALLNE